MVRPVVFFLLAAFVLWVIAAVATRHVYKGGVIASAVILAAFPGWNVLEILIEHTVPLVGAAPTLLHHAAYAAAAAAIAIFATRWRVFQGRRGRAAAGLLAGAAVLWLLVEILMAPAFGRGASWWIALYLLLFVALIGYLLQRRSGFVLMTRTANWFAVALLLLSFANITYNRPPVLDYEPPSQPETLAGMSGQEGGGENEQLPDIYFIVLDGYLRGDVLRDAAAYNNMPFLRDLETAGVHHADRAFANYHSMIMTVVSCLNMDYLDAFAPEQGAGNLRHLARLYNDNRVFKFLRGQGYVLAGFPPGLELLEPRATVDEYHRPSDILGEFELVLAENTAAARLLEALHYARHRTPLSMREVVERRRTLYVMETLPDIAATPSDAPRFVYACLTVPGPPFLFDRQGRRADLASPALRRDNGGMELSAAELRAAYVEQLHYTNTLLSQTLRDILEASAAPPVIIVLSSTGPAGVHFVDDGYENPLSLANLALFHGPDGVLELPEDVTPVNVFRILFNDLFGAELPLLPGEAIAAFEDAPFERLATAPVSP